MNPHGPLSRNNRKYTAWLFFRTLVNNCFWIQFPLLTSLRILIHFMHFVTLHSPWKYQKVCGFLMFSRGIERDQWLEMTLIIIFMRSFRTTLKNSCSENLERFLRKCSSWDLRKALIFLFLFRNSVFLLFCTLHNSNVTSKITSALSDFVSCSLNVLRVSGRLIFSK